MIFLSQKNPLITIRRNKAKFRCFMINKSNVFEMYDTVIFSFVSIAIDTLVLVSASPPSTFDASVNAVALRAVP